MSPPCIILTYTFLVAAAKAQQTPDFDKTDTPAVVWPDWMSSLPDGKSLADIAMPGTHDSMAFYGGAIAQCQSWPLLKQYEAGIRFVDIRCRHYENFLPIHHGVIYQRADYADVLQDTICFLQDHPLETILMRVKEEHTAFNNTRTFKETVTLYMEEAGSQWFLRTSTVPTLGEARGKIIILQNFNPPSNPLGILYPGNFRISDDYEVTDANKKWKVVESHITTAFRGDPQTTYITYVSGSHWLLFTPAALAKKLNPQLFSFLEREVVGRTRSGGVIIMDFPGAELVQHIIRSNWEFQ
ncbi:1-phosphatidylinositol phosphodiesterase-like [Pleurodeles waltl]